MVPFVSKEYRAIGIFFFARPTTVLKMVGEHVFWWLQQARHPRTCVRNLELLCGFRPIKDATVGIHHVCSPPWIWRLLV